MDEELQERAAVGEAEIVGDDDEQEKPRDKKLCMKDGKDDKTSRQEDFGKLEPRPNPSLKHPMKSNTIYNKTQELRRCADDTKPTKPIVKLFDRKNEVVELITEQDSDRKTVKDMTKNTNV